ELKANTSRAPSLGGRRRPIPGGNRNVDSGVAGGHRHALAAAPGDGTDIGILQFVRPENGFTCIDELKARIGKRVPDDLGRTLEAGEMRVGQEYTFVIGPNSFEYGP